MKSVNDCFTRVKKNCFLFIKSQETSINKFKSKERLLKSYLIPLCFWISKKINKKKPIIIGLAGGQGTGKTTITSIVSLILKKYFKLNVIKVSIDDFYKTRSERRILSITKHPLLMTRGVPGTHDYRMIFDFFKKVKSKNFKSIKLPKFDKSIDDRCKSKSWYKVKFRPDIIIFEGWCVGARAQNSYKIKKSINSLERVKDPNLIWRKYANTQLKTNYKKLFNYLDEIVYLKPSSFKLLQKWRIIQERNLWLNSKKKKNLKTMTKEEVINFMQTYQRITQNMFKDTPKYASIIFKLDSKHQINSAVYKKK
tara:strand:- start:1364 stop:2293 length:930 start_codon:yes stop_codon:yes gene_type:complete